MKKLLTLTPALLLTVFLGACSVHQPARAHAPIQPRMQAALDHLLAARRQLLRAAPNKGGHRVRALRLVDHAIFQVRRGIRHANRRHHHRH